MARLTTIWLLASMICTTYLHAQTVESIIETFGDDEIPELEELLRSLVASPFEINKVPVDSLASLWFLHPGQIEALAELHRRYFPNITEQHIAEATGLSEEIVAALFSARTPFHSQARVRSRTLRKNTGWQHSQRIDLTTEPFAAGLVAEKDPGEKRLTDFSAGYLRLAPLGQHSQLVLGNFVLQGGLGLAFAGAYGSPGLSQPAQAVVFTNPRIRPFRSTTENIAFNGAAASIEWSTLHMLVMLSKARRDARIEAGGIVSSRPVDGLHVSDGQRAARNALGENSGAVVFSATPMARLQVTASVLRQHFSHAIFPPDTIRQRFAFRGKSHTLFAVAFQYHNEDQKVTLVGEGATSAPGSAGILGLTVKAGRALLAASVWHADAGFHNDFGALPGNRTGETDNQSAFYLGAESIILGGALQLYALRSSTPWRTFRLPQPSARQDFGLQWQRRLPKASDLLLRIRFRSRESYVDADGTAMQPRGEIAQKEGVLSWRLQFRTRLHRKVNYRVRVEANVLSAARGNERGSLQTHELSWRSAALTTSFRYSYFSTTSFATRIYQFEPVLPGYSLPSAMFATGERLLLRCTWRITARLRLSGYLRYSSKSTESADMNWGVQLDFANR